MVLMKQWTDRSRAPFAVSWRLAMETDGRRVAAGQCIVIGCPKKLWCRSRCEFHCGGHCGLGESTGRKVRA